MRSSLERFICSGESSTIRNGDDDAAASLRERLRPAGVLEHGARARGHLETWEAWSFSPSTREGNPLIKPRRCDGRASQRANERADGDTADRRERSEAERTTRIRSSP